MRPLALLCAAALVPTAVVAGQRTTSTAKPSQPARPPAWVWPAEPATAGQPVCFRQPFVLSETPTMARLRVAARGALTLYLNGTLVADEPAGRAPRTLYVTRQAARGVNVLAIEARQTASDQPPAVMFEGLFRYASGREARLVSGQGVRASSRPTLGWHEAGFDDRSWPRAVVAGEPAPPGARAAAPTAPRRAAGPAPVGRGPASDTTRIVRYWDIGGGKPGEDPYARVRTVGERMLLATSVPAAADLPVTTSAGFTLYQTDSDHLSTEETAPGVWDYRRPDADQRLVRESGVDWCYFPHFAFPPRWYRDQVPFTRIRCREHEQPVQAFSPWEPRFATFVGRGYQKLGEHYGGSRSSARSTPSGLYLGIHGDYGEAGLLMGARVTVPGQREDWQRRFGNLHDHLGWWCADPLARAAFRDWALRKYRDLEVLNAAWKTRFRTPGQIAYPSAPSDGRRWWLDYVSWYEASTANITDTVCRVARRTFPQTLLMLPLGFGDEDPRGGNDNSLLPRVAARSRVDVRSTHGGFKPFAANQASMLGRIASACRFYGVPFWTEPPSAIDADGQVGRIFAAASLGSKGYFDWASNVQATRDAYYRYGKYLRVERPIVDVAMLYPSTSHLLQPDVGYPQTFAKGCADIRDVLNYDIVDERMVHDGALDRYRVLVLWEGTVAEADTLARIRDWVQAGGVLVAYDFGKIETVEGDRSWFADVFGYAGRLRPAGFALRYESREPEPARSRVSVGQPGADSFLAGAWYDPETLGGVSRRWTGAEADVRFPVDPDRAYVAVVRASYPPEAARGRREVLVNGVRVGVMDQAVDTTYRFGVPASALDGRNVATVTLRSDTFRPSRVLRGSSDSREVGTWVTYVEMDSTGGVGAATDPGLPPGRFVPTSDLRRLRTEWARPFGRGWTVYYPATRRNLPGYYEAVRYVTYHLSALDPTKRDAIAVDNAWDGVYATLLSDKVLFYNPLRQAVTRSVAFSPEDFAGRTDVQAPRVLTQTLVLEPASIGAMALDDPPAEMLLQCEKFTSLGGLKPQEGAGYSPGRGPTHVLVPTGGQIATRFEVDAPGAYRVFARGVRRGAPARVQMLVDGRALAPPAAALRGSRGAATFLAGTATLSRGVHSLELRPLPRQDVRADYVILTTDRTIAGYGFAIGPASR